MNEKDVILTRKKFETAYFIARVTTNKIRKNFSIGRTP